MAVTTRTLAELERQLRALTALYAGETRVLAGAWAEAWRLLLPGFRLTLNRVLAEGLTPAQLVADSRVIEEMRAALQALDTLATNATTGAQTVAGTAIQQAAADSRALLAASLPRNYPAAGTLIGLDQIRQIEARVNQRITTGFEQLPERTALAIRANLLTGAVKGENPRQTARRLVRGAGDGFNLGLARAMTITRTELLDAHRLGQQAQERRDAEAGAVRGWVWVASLGPRTCRSCVAMHGTEWALDDPGPIDHHQGRCARVPLTPSWADLGITGVLEPPSALADADAWIAGLDDAGLQRLLGQGGAEAYRVGDYPVSDWATRKSHTGWRDSITPNPPGRNPTPTGGTRPGTLQGV